MYGKTRAGIGLPPIVDDTGIMLSKPIGGKFADSAMLGNLFSVANQAVVSTTAALATTWTGLGLCNPTGSGHNFIIHEFGWSQVAQSVAGAVGLMCASTTGFTAASLAPVAAMYGLGASVAWTSATATIGTPILYRVCGSMGSLATTGYGSLPPNIYMLNGSLVLPPGRSVLTYTTAATTSALVFYFLWEEVDI